jgi:hypothetical protein
MTEVTPKFHQNHATQYTNIGLDLRYYADQRFKIVTVFLIASGFLINVAAGHTTIAVGLIGFVFFLCRGCPKSKKTVIPANAGISQCIDLSTLNETPAFAGVTKWYFLDSPGGNFACSTLLVEPDVFSVARTFVNSEAKDRIRIMTKQPVQSGRLNRQSKISYNCHGFCRFYHAG